MSISNKVECSKNKYYKYLHNNKFIIYIYDKNQELANIQLDKIKSFCKEQHINVSKIYIDVLKYNKLENKINLKKILNKKNSNILISKCSRLTRNTTELLKIEKICHQNNINVFDISSGDFIFNTLSTELDRAFNEIISKGGENLQRRINVLLVEPGKLPVKKNIPNTLYAKQQLVNGSIEYAYLFDDKNAVLICNEEGKINGMEPNRDIGYDIIFGPFIIVGDKDTGEDVSLSEEQIDRYMKKFGNMSIERTNAKLEVLKMKKLEDFNI